MTKLSTHIRWQIVEKSLAGLSERQIARHLGISKTTVYCVYYLFKKYGCVKNILTLRERPRIFGNDDMKYLEVLLKKSRLVHLEIAISNGTLERKENKCVEFILRTDESADDRRTLSHQYGWNISKHHARKATFFVREQIYN
ncbi:5159_t:CDS:2 [Funneliformis caledonium]|uniref:5159_t:CDS:1 n=1 Tax=Funneliformis caledonium TaxID=1117310 RepID=A0A9N9A1M8_9GLOM|nr:5159_t:CDS:2 [Funneliformis caledonium]